MNIPFTEFFQLHPGLASVCLVTSNAALIAQKQAGTPEINQNSQGIKAFGVFTLL